MAKPRVPKKVTNETNVMPAVEAASNDIAAAKTNGSSTTLNGLAAKAVRKKATPKPEIVKTEPRANLVPINLEDEIRRLAYLMSERRGFEPGHEAEDWLAAEREIRQRYHPQSA